MLLKTVLARTRSGVSKCKYYWYCYTTTTSNITIKIDLLKRIENEKKFFKILQLYNFTFFETWLSWICCVTNKFHFLFSCILTEFKFDVTSDLDCMWCESCFGDFWSRIPDFCKGKKKFLQFKIEFSHTYECNWVFSLHWFYFFISDIYIVPMSPLLNYWGMFHRYPEPTGGHEMGVLLLIFFSVITIFN